MIDWIKSEDGLPDFNRLVLAFCEGFKEHSGVTWGRKGFAFMVRHNEEKFTMKDNWAMCYYNDALKILGADVLEVTHWIYLENPKE